MSENTIEQGGSVEVTVPGDSIEHISRGSDLKPIHIVAIGASAGGLESLERFFENIDETTGAAFVVIQHLSPDTKSAMPDLLSRKTQLQVLTAADQMPIHSNIIYILPPRMNLVIEKNILYLRESKRSRIPNNPINMFFDSLATDVGEYATAVVLSGAGSDGAMGVRKIHEAGGKVYIESPAYAKFDGMPTAALSQGVHNGEGTPFKIAGEIFGKNVDDYSNLTSPVKNELAGSDGREQVFKVIEDHYGVDFTRYDIATVSRPIDRRMIELNISQFNDYSEYIDNNPDELASLYHNMLIGITQFFRDPEAFEQLKQDIKRIVESKYSGEEVRVWSAGCAFGEEAYSLAMLFSEEISRSGKPLKLRIFATDIDSAVLHRATNAVYHKSQMENIPEAFLSHYFNESGDGYKASITLRSSVIFARHNLLNDPPFAKLDLIACRNLLIYLDNSSQQQVLSLFYSNLNSRGTLFLGSSDSLGKYHTYFGTRDGEWKIYSKSEHSLPALSTFQSKQEMESEVPVTVDGLQRTENVTRSMVIEMNPDAIDHALLEKYVPSGFLVDESLDVMRVYGEPGFTALLSADESSHNFRSLLDENLYATVSACIQRAKRERLPVEYSTFVVVENGEEHSIDLKVVPVTLTFEENISCFLVSFSEEGVLEKGHAEKRVTQEKSVKLDQLAAIQEELVNSKLHLQATIEELEATKEDLFTSNEELRVSSEQLQSVNEELHAVNVEYQSQTIKLNQLSIDEERLFRDAIEPSRKHLEVLVKARTEELARRTSEYKDLYENAPNMYASISPDSASILNCNNRLAVTTGYSKSELIGMKIFDLYHPDCHSDAQAAFRQFVETGFVKSRQLMLNTKTGERIQVLLNVDAVRDSEGNVIHSRSTWVDVSDLEFLKRENNTFLLATQGSDIGIWDWDFQTGEQNWSEKFHELLNYPDSWHERLTFDKPAVVHVDDRDSLTAAFKMHFSGESEFGIELRLQTFNGHYRWFHLQGGVVRNDDGKVIRMVGSAQDVHEVRQAQDELKSQAEIQRFITQETNDGWWDWHLKADYLYMSPRFWETLGVDPETRSHSLVEWKKIFHPKDLAEFIENYAKHSNTGGKHPLVQEVRYKHADGHWATVICRGRIIEWDNSGQPLRMVGVQTDITKIKQQKNELKEINRQLAKSNDDLEQFAYITSHDLKAPLRGISTLVTFMEEDLHDVLENGSQEAESVRANLKRLSRQATRMEGLISGVLDYSRVDSAEYSFEEVKVRELLCDIATDHNLQVGRQIISPTELPVLHTDPIMIEQVLSNLISNATKFHSNPGELVIEINCERGNDFYTFSVTDNGPGIKPEFHSRIFDMFQTLQNKDTYESTGIGLTLVKRIVEKFGGSVFVESEEGSGATFRFTWPITAKEPVN